MQRLNFQIVECSGEDPDYPVTELLIHTAQSKGWMSPRFCEYPQQITLEFFAPVRIRHIQFLSHESRIASKVEIFTGMPDYSSVIPNIESRYARLGYLTFDPNDRSSFQARELKSVYVDAPCLSLKLLFHKCHMNKHNIFNQIGLILLNFYGEPLTGFLTEPLAETKLEGWEYGSVFTNMQLERLRELEIAKHRAIRIEDFEEARVLKKEIDRMKSIGDQLRVLEEKKMICIQNEDYAAAKLVKAEIDQLRNMLNVPSPSLENYMENNNTNNSQFMNEIKEMETEYDEAKVSEDVRPTYSKAEAKANDKDSILHEEVKQDLQKSGTQFFQTELKIENGNNTNGKKISPSRNAKYQSYDDQVVPAIRNLNKSQNSLEEMENSPKDEMQKTAENLNDNTHRLADPLVPFLGEDICKKLFSKNWSLREEALNTIEKEYNNSKSTGSVLNMNDPAGLFVAIMGVVSYSLSDNINQIAENSMNILQKLIRNTKQAMPPRSDFVAYSENVIASLLEKLGDSNQRIRGHSINCFIDMARSPLITCNHIVTTLLKPNIPTKHKIDGSTKHTIGKLMLLRQLVQEFKINNNDIPLNPVVEFVEEKIESPNNEIRAYSVTILGDIYRIIGEAKLRPLLPNMRPAQMAILDKEFKNPGQALQALQSPHSLKGSPKNQKGQKIQNNINNSNSDSINNTKKSVNTNYSMVTGNNQGQKVPIQQPNNNMQSSKSPSQANLQQPQQQQQSRQLQQQLQPQPQQQQQQQQQQRQPQAQTQPQQQQLQAQPQQQQGQAQPQQQQNKTISLPSKALQKQIQTQNPVQSQAVVSNDKYKKK